MRVNQLLPASSLPPNGRKVSIKPCTPIPATCPPNWMALVISLMAMLAAIAAAVPAPGAIASKAIAPAPIAVSTSPPPIPPPAPGGPPP